MKSFWKSNAKQLSGEIHFIIIGIIFLAIALIYPLFYIVYFIYLIYLFKNKYLNRIIKITLIVFSLALIASYYIPKNQEDKLELTGIVLEKKSNSIVVLSNLKRYKIYTRDDFIPGDYLSLKLKRNNPKQASYPGDFNEALYLKSEYFFSSYHLLSANKLKTYKTLSYYKFLCLNYYKERMDPLIYSFFSALVFGNNEIDADIKEDLSRLNLMHILALSGFHLGLVYKAFYWLFFIIFHKKYLSERLSLGLVTAYSLFCGLKVSLLRALLFMLLSYYNQKNDAILTKLDIYSLVFLIVLLRPLKIYSLSFILSFLASFILIFMPDFIKTKNKILRDFLSGIIILLWTFPFLTGLNNSLSVFSLLSFFLMDFYAYFFIPVSFLYLLIPKLSFKLALIYESFNLFISTISKSFNLTFGYMSVAVRIIYYLALIFFLFCLTIKKKRLLAFITLSLALIIFKLSPSLINNYVEFIDVGQGDSIYLESDSKGFLIDAFNVIDFLDKKDIRSLEAIFITHSDNDHMEDLKAILETRSVKIVYTNLFDDGIDLICKEEKTRLKKLSLGSELKIGKATIKVLSPQYDFYDKNSNSLVLDITMLNRSFLFMGDSTIKTESFLLEQSLLHRYDILKVGHHGSNTSTSSEFLEIVRPKYSVISLGVNNYGMPNDLVIERLKKYSQIYITKDSGNIKIFKDCIKTYRNLCYNY